MSLYLVSNIVIPLSLLSYMTFLKISRKQKLGYGQWVCMVIAISISNILSFLIKFKGWILLFDLIIKITISFLPPNLNNQIQKLIRSLPLQHQIQTIRKLFISYFLTIHSKFTQFLLLKMNESEKKQFKNMILDKLSIQTDKQITLSKINIQKQYKSIAVNCDIISTQYKQTHPIIQNFINRKQSKQRINIQQPIPNKEINTLKASQKISYNSNFNRNQHPTKEQKPKATRDGRSNKSPNLQRQTHEGLNIRRSTTNILDEIDNYDDERQKKHTQNIQLISFSNSNSQSPQQAYNFKKSRNKVHDLSDTAQRLLNELDVSVSEYSSIFQEQEPNSQNKVLLCKIETIVEIGNGANLRLEIYNLELYSNDDIRIVSLYGRQFEKHRLISMKPLPNNYYELKLTGSAVHQRKVKFRANAQPFMKFLQNK